MSEKVRDVMHAKLETHAPDAPLSVIAKTMKQKDVGVVPIVDKDKLVGLITDRDIALRALADGKDIAQLRAKDVMTKSPDTCQDSDTIYAAVKLMEAKRVRRLPVLNKERALVGMLSLGDVSAALSNEMSGRLVKAQTVCEPDGGTSHASRPLEFPIR